MEDVLQCPECGQTEELFAITATCIITAYVNTWEEMYTDESGDMEWDGSSNCRCLKCGHIGTVADFHTLPPDEGDRP